MDLTWETIAAADETLKRWRKLVNQEVNAIPTENVKITQAICEDLDTPRAIQIIRAFEKDRDLELKTKVGQLLFADKILGLDLSRKEETRALTPELEELLRLRGKARSDKNWTESDRLRHLLEEQGLVIADLADRQDWQWR